MLNKRDLLLGGAASLVMAVPGAANAHHTAKYKNFKLDQQYVPQRVFLSMSYAPGTIVVDPRNYVAPDSTADCIDHSEPSNPLREFAHGTANEMMLLRACFVFSPIFPTAGLGYALEKDGAGNAAMVASSAFVQEPS